MSSGIGKETGATLDLTFTDPISGAWAFDVIESTLASSGGES